MAEGTARARAAQLSSQILKLSRMHGKVTDSGPLPVSYGSQSNKYYMRHDWAIYGLPNDVLETGMKNLHEALPQNGWKITSYGPAHSEARQLTIKAEHAQDHYTVLIEWIKGKSPGDAPTATDQPEIGVLLTSPAYEEPAGSDPT
ncbi:hypothetical protein ACFOSC_16120 [Streptantibioticus rubrisoli]|uniref:Uncharacterized protein n=1 Tax=Streptantibioticus rubrisoli TaxID=1387313 RepID=A0ABT1PAV6_9ACTN|nr:hypothetical protein [Streptantibioticus rubrisoli]MCQ4042502.1 hypothetical protein [Streptantibioticus rubrisoli]